MFFKRPNIKNSPDLYSFLEKGVKAFNPDYYYTSLFYDQILQKHVFALYGFYKEIEQVGLSVREKGAAQIRLAWRRDRLREIIQGKTVTESPDLQALSGLVEKTKVSVEDLNPMIEAYQNFIEEEEFKTEAELDTFVFKTYGAQIRLILSVILEHNKHKTLNLQTGSVMLEALIRALGYFYLGAQSGPLIRLGRCPFPVSDLDRMGLKKEDLLAKQNKKEMLILQKALFEKAQKAYQALIQNKIDDFAFPLFLPACLIPAYLKAFSRPAYDPFRLIWHKNISELNRKYTLLVHVFKGKL